MESGEIRLENGPLLSLPASYMRTFLKRSIACLFYALASASTFASDAGTQHPRLFFTANELAGLRSKFNSPAFAVYKLCLLTNAKSLMEYRGTAGTGEPGDAPKLWTDKKPEEVLCSLLWAYLLTGETPYRDKTLEVARIEMKQFQFDSRRYQEEFSMMRAAFMAIIYDSLYRELSDEDRTAFQAYFDRSFTSFFPVEARGGQWGFDMNIGAVFFSSSGIVAMARLGETPQAEQVLAKCLTGIQRFQKATLARHADGAYPESSLYWDFGITWYLSFADALKRVTGSDHGLMSFEFFKNQVNYVATMLGGNNELFPFGDTQPMTFGAAIGARLGALYDQPLMRWLADANIRRAPAELETTGERGYFQELAFLWRDSTPAPPQRPPLPQLSILQSTQWGVLRSDATAVPALELAVKGHPGYGLNHNPPDAASFMLLVKGVPFLIAPGYYQPNLDSHNVVIVKGLEQRADTLAKVSGQRNRDTGQMIVTMNAPRSTNLVMQRNFVMVRDKAVIILDDVPAGSVSTYLQAGLKTEMAPDQQSVIISGTDSSLSAQFFGPLKDLTVSAPRSFGKSWVYAKLAAEGKVVWQTMKGSYEASADQPQIIVLNVVAPNAGQPDVKVQRENGLITVSFPDGVRVRFTQGTDKLWKLQSSL